MSLLRSHCEERILRRSNLVLAELEIASRRTLAMTNQLKCPNENSIEDQTMQICLYNKQKTLKVFKPSRSLYQFAPPCRVPLGLCLLIAGWGQLLRSALACAYRIPSEVAVPFTKVLAQTG